MSHRCGMVTLLGRPNVGKSTLLNALVGQKVSIVSNKPQTTRRRVLGILTEPDYQIAFVDTPGIHPAHTQLGKLMNEAASKGLADVDLILAVVDVSKPPGKEDKAIAETIKRTMQRESALELLLCLNKMDILKPDRVVDHVNAYCKLYGTDEYMLTSLTKRQNLDKLLAMIVGRLPEGENIFPEDEYTDQPMRTLAAELIREKALRLTREEIPHAVATIVDTWDERLGDDLVRISASIVVEKDGQKAVLIGKGGSMLKRIGSEARQELEQILEKRVFLELFVKVRKEWRQNPRMLRDLEYWEG